MFFQTNNRRTVPHDFGFSLAEIIVGAALFALIAVAVYQGYASLSVLVSAGRVKTLAADLANEEIEIIKNLPFEQVGIVSGIPVGVIERDKTVNKSGFDFNVVTTVRNIDDPFDGQIGGDPNDLSPADYKLVQVDISCPTCRDFPTMNMSARISPKNLETASANGALFVKVFDANGIPVPQADVHIENNQLNPAIIIDEVTNNNGELQIVDAPPGVNAYEVTATKSGFTTDRTYPPGAPTNPNPSKPHSTVVLQQVTQVSFLIDKTSTLNVGSITDDCAIVPSASFSMDGTKVVGTSPDVLKYSATHSTDSFGSLLIPGIEGDSYLIQSLSSSLDLVGTNPVMPFSVLPDAVQDVRLIMQPKDPNTLLVVVKDLNSQLPLSDVAVTLTGTNYNQSLVTDRGFLRQTDWSGGGGQSMIGNPNQYDTSDGNVDTTTSPGEVTLFGSFGVFAPSGNLTSSTFDTGTSSDFYQINWKPVDQPPQTGFPSAKFQVGSNNTDSQWQYDGPDGTQGTYYDVTNSNIHSSHSGHRYFRYKLFLSTAVSTSTPNISEVSVVFTSSCIPPGQVSFSGLSDGTYTLNVTKPGYGDHQVQLNISNSWQSYSVELSPS